MSNKPITIQELESYLWGAAVFLRNKIDAGDYKGYIFPLLFYKRICDVWDEEYEKALADSNNNKEFALAEINHRFKIPEGHHWRDLRNVSKNVGQAILKSMHEIEKANPNTLFGIFGDANWGNKERLSDETLKDLIEHFSSKKLTLSNVLNDEMGTGYEYLIKKFADDSGHTAAEFYTNRTVVTLMTMILDPQPQESIYDPTCGSGGMLLEAVNYLKRNNKEFRSLKLYGQERNAITSGIARMNMFLHGIEDFKIVKGDTLEEPAFLKEDKLQTFNCILANPPYSISKWNYESWNSDPYGRNIYGSPPRGRADYAFLQHIVSSLDKKNGRAAILFPHGVLFRDGEGELRKKMVEDDKLEAVIGLGPNLFYNASMEACIVVLNANKKLERKKKVFFINALNEITREAAQSYLSKNNIKNIFDLYTKFKSIDEKSCLADFEEIKNNQFVLSIPLYVKTKSTQVILDPEEAIAIWLESSKTLSNSIPELLENLKVIK